MFDKRSILGFAFGLLFCFLFVSYTLTKSKRNNGLRYFPKIQARHQTYIRKIPQDISFAGETVHFKTPSSYQRFERELKYNTKNNSSTRLLLRNVRIWLPEIEHIVRKHQIPDDFKFVAVAESNLTNAVSHKSAVGFWQFTEATAKELGLEINEEVDERYHPLLATEAACLYFKKAYRTFGNWTSAAASYNRGIAGLRRAYESQEAENFYDLELNDETSRYLYKILAMKDLITNPNKYNFPYRFGKGGYIKKIEVDTSIHNLVKFCKKLNLPYLTLKEYNPWILQNSLTVKPGKKYIILIPYSEIGITGPSRPQKPKDSGRVPSTVAESPAAPSVDSIITGIELTNRIIF